MPKPTAKGYNLYKAALKVHNFNKSVDYHCKQIDEGRTEADIDYHQDENETGRVWSF